MQGAPSLILGVGTRSYVPKLKGLSAATKTWCAKYFKKLTKVKYSIP